MSTEFTPEEQEVLNGIKNGTIKSEPAKAASPQFSAEELKVLDQISRSRVDTVTGEPIPPQASGANPDWAKNKSILSIGDRAALSLGNDVGRINYLKNKYEDAGINNKGQLTVKQDGEWYMADPAGLDEMNGALEKTKEIISDYAADMAGAALQVGGAMGGSILGTSIGPGGTVGGAVAGAATGEFVKTSLGRAIGTYEATPAEQTADIGLEAIYQLAGEKFFPGMKKGVDVLGDAVERLGVRANAEQGLKKMAMWWSSFNAGTEPMETVLKHGKHVNQKMKSLYTLAGASDVKYIEMAKEEQISRVKQLAKEAPRMLSNTYKTFQKKVVDAVPDTFQSNIRQTSVESLAKIVDDGFGKVVRKAPGQGIQEVTDKVEIVKLLKWSAENGRFPKGFDVTLKTSDELAESIRRTGKFEQNAIKLATDPEAYQLINKLMKTIKIGAESKQLSGKDAAKTMMDFKREMSDVLWTLSAQADDEGLNALRKSFEGYSKLIDSNITKSLDSVGQGGLYTKLNSEWSKINTPLIPLTNAYKRSLRGGGDQVFETFLNKVATMPGKNAVSKGSLSTLEAAAKNIGDDSAARYISHTRTMLDITDAAVAFNPYVNGAAKAAGYGMGIYALSGANMPLMLALGAGATLKSPRAALATVNGARSAFQGLDFLKSLPKEQINALSANPQAASALINSMVDAQEMGAAVIQKTTGQLMSGAGATEMQESQFNRQVQAGAEQLANQTTAPRQLDVMDQIRSAIPAHLLHVVDKEAKMDFGASNVNKNGKAPSDDLGGASYGGFQFNLDNTKTYIKESKYKDEFKGIDPSSARGAKQLAEKFKEIYAKDPVGFATDQAAFMDKLLVPAKDTVKRAGKALDDMPLDVLKTIASTGTQFGNAYNRLDFVLKQPLQNLSDVENPKQRQAYLQDIMVRKMISFHGNQTEDFAKSMSANRALGESLPLGKSIEGGDPKFEQKTSFVYKAIQPKLAALAKTKSGKELLKKISTDPMSENMSTLEVLAQINEKAGGKLFDPKDMEKIINIYSEASASKGRRTVELNQRD